MDIKDIYDSPASKICENVDLRLVVAAMKLIKADHKPRKGGGDGTASLLDDLYVTWLLDERNPVEKDLAMMLVFEEIVLESELTDILLPERKKARIVETGRSLEAVKKIIREGQSPKQEEKVYEEI